ncbi:MAG: diguanylate cyclase, partial [Candidatus Bipolaricaulota bacterium]
REKYRAIFEAATDAIFIMEGNKFIDCNEKTEEIFECSRDEIVGAPPYKFSPEKQPDGRQSKEKALEKINAALEGEPQSFEWLHSTIRGETFPTYVTLSRFEIDGEKFLMAIVRDITELKKAEEKLRENEQKLRKLHDAVDRFQNCQSEEKLYDAMLEVAREVLGFDASLIYLSRDNQLVPVASDQLETSELPAYKKDEALMGATYTNGKTIWGQDVREVEYATPESPDPKAYMSVPIGKLGVFQAASKEKGAFDQVDIELAEILVGHLNEEIKRIRLEGELKEQAIRDPLTGLYNRRYFNETLSKEVGRSERYGYDIAFLMIDINRFKEVNDHYSHQTGDKVLEEVARLLQENVREADIVVRYGGDEFLVMLPETNGGSKHTANRLRNEIDRWNNESDLLDFTLTLAIGSSHWNPDQGRDVEEALKEADKKMYESKER